MTIDAAIVAGAIAGGVTGGIIAVVLALGVLRWDRRSRRSRSGDDLPGQWRGRIVAQPAASAAPEAPPHVGAASAGVATPPMWPGGSPFRWFSDRAKRVLALSQDEAVRLNHNYIGTEHLLLGLVREGEGVAARVLDSLGITLSNLRAGVEAIVKRGESTTSGSEITLSPRTKRAIELAVDEMRRLGHSQVATEHLLLGLVREGEGVATAWLESQGVSTAQVRDRVLATIARPPQATTPAPPAAGPGQPTSVPRGSGFSRFGERGKRVFATAQEEAIRLNHNYIGTEHLLLGLVRQEDIAARVLVALGVELEKVRTAVHFIVGRGDAPTSPSEITLSPRTKKVVELAGSEANAMGHLHVESEHILLGLLDEGEGIASGVLESLGVTLDKAHAMVLDELAKSGTAVPSTYSRPVWRKAARAFGRFSDRAKRAVAIAHGEAMRMGHPTVGTEHLIVALAHDSTVAPVFEALGLTVDSLRAAAARAAPPSTPITPPPEVVLTNALGPDVQRVLEVAVAEADRQRSDPVLPQHLLAGVIAGEGLGKRLLIDLGATEERIRELIDREMREGS